MRKFTLADHPHRRFNSLSGEWVLNSPHRSQRPWQGMQESAPARQRPAYDPDCYLCPGNKRAGGVENPEYEHTFVFDNDFSALLDQPAESPEPESPFLRVSVPRGICRVGCFSPRHDLTLPELPVEGIRRVVDLWAHEVAELGQRFQWVQVFENKGEMMGCSNPHPHCQIWAIDTLPNEPAKEDLSQARHFDEKGSILLLDYLELEAEKGERLIQQNEHWLAVVPFWAIWPFEALILPREHVLHLSDLSSTQRDSLADFLKSLLTRYDNLFSTRFPYSMGWHGTPLDGSGREHWQLHAHIYPPLLRSATVRKFMVGFETLAEPQRDLSPELAAERLRSLPDSRLS